MQTLLGNSIVVDKDMVERFRTIQKHLDVNTRVMAIKSGVSEDKLYQFLSARQNLTLESLRLLKKAFPDISTEYLISNQGSPLVTMGNSTDDVPTLYIRKEGNVNVKFEGE